MDSDDFGSDLADEDFMVALEQASANVTKRPISSISHKPPQNSSRSAEAAACALELEDLPSDAFSSPEPVIARTAVVRPDRPQISGPRATNGLVRSSSGKYRQSTLFGGHIEDGLLPSQSSAARVYRADRPREDPSHHELNKLAMQNWIYPTNLGAIRDYQFSIVKNSLFNNTLVALPTGLGKTFIAATVMLNFYQWTKSAKIVFVAPTKPLVAQQVDACYNIAGIPRSETTLLTGDIPPALRVDEWQKRRVFFMTPQTLLNDLSHGYADPKSIVLLVVDEAHRAVGEYAYAKVCKLIRRFSTSIRVLALTATPGSKVETVQEVIDNLGISHCEIRTEESLDIRQYVHQRNVEQVVLDPSDEMNMISELFSEALKPLTEKLSSQNIWYGRQPMAITAFGLMQQQKEWFASRGSHANQFVQLMMRAVFTVLTSLAHSIKLLNFHGVKPFFENMRDFRSDIESKGEKGSKYKRLIVDSPSFQEMMQKVEGWLKQPDFVGHPKLTALSDLVLNHFMDNEKNTTTRVIVFSEYRDSAEDITRTLNQHRPLIKASVFVGQADSKRGEGMKQAQQIETIERFRKGDFNVLVATSIGEEGLDIGQVDLIVCYDASASPIRMLQRMGRTGRKRAGNIALLLMRGKEEEQFAKSKDNYEKMQKLICEGSRFNFRFDLSTRIVPREIRPELEKRQIEIPVENTQDTSLPEPKKRRAALAKKKPPKKFHMPDGVETGFRSVSDLLGAKAPTKSPPKVVRNTELEDLADVPLLDDVTLSGTQLAELNRSYRDLPFNHKGVEETAIPSMTSYPERQRRLQPVALVKHGRYTRQCVELLSDMSRRKGRLMQSTMENENSNYRDITVKPFVSTDGEEEDESDEQLQQSKIKQKRQPVKKKRKALPHTEKDCKRRKSEIVNSLEPTWQAASQAMEGSATEDEGEDGDEDGPNSSLGGGYGSKHRRKTTSMRIGVNSDEIGEDCERDSDGLQTDGSDDGSDLVGFVVSDGVVSSSFQGPTSTMDLIPSESTTAPDSAVKPFFVPTTFSATQESEGIPDLDALMRSTGPSGGVQGTKLDFRQKRVARNRRQVVDDEDSDTV